MIYIYIYIYILYIYFVYNIAKLGKGSGKRYALCCATALVVV